MKRKNIYVVATGLFFLISSFLSLSAFAQKPITSLKENTQVLFIQVANAGELVPNKNEAGSYRLTLKNVDPFTSYFTDRPNRVTGIVPTQEFVSMWQNRDIQSSPPNVAIETSDLKNGHKINRVFVLSNPVYDAQKQEITYSAKSLSKERTHKPISMGYTVLFIDDFHWHGNKFG
ncbi:MAG: hypothetical protein H0U71_06900 [Gammaproteobacteria bacterium]|nr:hypothetical protein [Gammaproteobacteria bacterium]